MGMTTRLNDLKSVEAYLKDFQAGRDRLGRSAYTPTMMKRAGFIFLTMPGMKAI